MDSQYVLYAYEHYEAELSRYTTAMTRDPAAAEDLVQETFARLALETTNGVAPANVRAWLFKVARNIHISNCRRRNVAGSHADEVSRSWELTARSAEDEVLLHEREASIQHLLDQLDPVDRSSLVMAALGYSGAEIGSRLGRTENAVRVRLFRARAKLRTELLATSVDSV